MAILLIPINFNLSYYPSEIEFYNFKIEIPKGYKLNFIITDSVYIYPGIYNYILYNKFFLEIKAKNNNITLSFSNNKNDYIIIIFKRYNIYDTNIKKINKDFIYEKILTSHTKYKKVIFISNSQDALKFIVSNFMIRLGQPPP